MDIEANLKEQTELAADIMLHWDDCPESGEFNEYQLDWLANAAYRMAELIQAANEYNLRPKNSQK